MARVTYGTKLADTRRHIENAKDALLVLRNNGAGDQADFALSQLHMAVDDLNRAWDKADEETGKIR